MLAATRSDMILRLIRTELLFSLLTCGDFTFLWLFWRKNYRGYACTVIGCLSVHWLPNISSILYTFKSADAGIWAMVGKFLRILLGFLKSGERRLGAGCHTTVTKSHCLDHLLIIFSCTDYLQITQINLLLDVVKFVSLHSGWAGWAAGILKYEFSLLVFLLLQILCRCRVIVSHTFF